jgi:hypothetical protein
VFTCSLSVADFTDLRLGPPRRAPEDPAFPSCIPDLSLAEVTGFNIAVPVATERVRLCHEFHSLVVFSCSPKPSDVMAATNLTGPSRPKDNLRPKISKASKISELHAFFVTLFRKCSIMCQIKFTEFAERYGVPLGTTGMAEPRLPWKKMSNVLAEQGLEICGWPEGVPKPRSEPRLDSKADKGISGFNAEQIGALHKAMKSNQIDFQPLTGGHNVPRVRQREDDIEEVEIRPSKKQKLAATRKNPQDFMAMKSVMKFNLA